VKRHYYYVFNTMFRTGLIFQSK